MFIPDERFQAIFGEADTWTLQVKYVQARDEGEYECQISTDPKKSHIIKLNIVGESSENFRSRLFIGKRKKGDVENNRNHITVPKIEILGDRDMYVKTGSTVAIRCVIKQSLEGPFYVFWYHEGDRVLNYQLGKIDIQTKRIDQDTVSSLVIHNARREDSGNYTCSPSNLDSASVQLHVLNGEYVLVCLALRGEKKCRN